MRVTSPLDSVETNLNSSRWNKIPFRLYKYCLSFIETLLLFRKILSEDMIQFCWESLELVRPLQFDDDPGTGEEKDFSEAHDMD